ncbi:MAG TPA: peptidylprolyl isomerase [Bacteroidales bacterium]|jgi:FKBP-type peptidyl-prolyl cis-trans isomerase FkpA|nr:peptidylprolyl isomerase [Bacteroidales bacterium]
MKKLGFLIIIAIFAFIACEDDDPAAEQLKKDIELIETYLQDSSLVAESTSSGLYYIIEEEGTGNYPNLSSVIRANYKGMLLNGEVFDEGTVKDYPLYVYIKGWQEGMQLFRAGGKGTLFIPSGLGYGSTARSGIPPNSVLIFEVELINVAN